MVTRAARGAAAAGQARGAGTRELIVAAAERLFAERGLAAVSNRQVSEAAGQANNFAVGYHFGTKADLVLAVYRRHSEPVQLRRRTLLAGAAGSADLRLWVSCLVNPTTEHLDALGSPSWFARFLAQAMTEPAYREVVVAEASGEPTVEQALTGLVALLPALPPEVLDERGDMSRQLIVHVCAERERALQEGTATPRASWAATGQGLVDALVGLWLAPVTRARDEPPGGAPRWT